MSKLEEAKEILSSLKVPAKQQNGMCCCVLLAMANLTEEQAWGSAANNWIRIHDVIAFANSNYGTTYAENSRETFRKQAMHHFRNAAFIEDNGKATNSPNYRYRLTDEMLHLIQSFGTADWERSLARFMENHDSLVLNSLIGSPLGYIGSDGGELLKRVQESDVGLILIDEFEKADNAVFNYFLDVLENGKIVNSQADEYDVNGYIIVFTSNISKENFKKKISPELRSRFDYKGMFNLLTDEDKRKFVHFRVNQIISKYREFVSHDLPEKLHDNVVARIDVSNYKNMRDLNKKIKDTFVELIGS